MRYARARAVRYARRREPTRATRRRPRIRLHGQNTPIWWVHSLTNAPNTIDTATHHTYIKSRVYNHTPSVRDATTRDDDTRRRDATTRDDDVRADEENSQLHVRPNPRPSRARETRVRVDDDDDDEKGNERNDDSSRAR
jgi:Tfp pilus assembly protein FimT